MEGEPLQLGEDSALTAFVRLLAATNQPMNCSLDLWVTSLDVELGNLAIAFLELLAGADPDVAQTSFGLLGEVLGWGFSQWALEEIADSGVCPALTPQVLEDMRAVDVLYEPEAYHLLASFIALMEWLEDGNDNLLYPFAEAATEAHQAEAIPPVEELVRDVATQPLVGDLIEFLPVLINPKSHNMNATSIAFDDLVALALAMLEPANALRDIEPALQRTLALDATWTMVHGTAVLLAHEDAAMHSSLDVASELLALDPELEMLEELATQLDNSRLIQPVLRLLEIEDLSQSLLRSTSSSDGRQAPRAFVAGLIVDGTVQEFLNIMDWLLLQAEDITQSSEKDTQ